jgi:predicted SAM-dependent methyltransferase
MRSITSYAKVRTVVSNLIRGKPLFVRKKKLELLNIGCGPHPDKRFINLDYSWSPEIDICWDITKKKYPIASVSLTGIYTEHCMEHIPVESFRTNCGEFFRMLKPTGNIRIIVPDGELYFSLYEERKRGNYIKMPYEENYITPMARINGLFRNHGHQFIYDFATMKKILEEAGFIDIEKESYLKGRNPCLLIDTPGRADESLYVEATRP